MVRNNLIIEVNIKKPDISQQGDDQTREANIVPSFLVPRAAVTGQAENNRNALPLSLELKLVSRHKQSLSPQEVPQEHPSLGPQVSRGCKHHCPPQVSHQLCSPPPLSYSHLLPMMKPIYHSMTSLKWTQLYLQKMLFVIRSHAKTADSWGYSTPLCKHH